VRAFGYRENPRSPVRCQSGRGIDAFIVMVAPMDKAGFFSCGTNSDYTVPAARDAKS
jgi:acyl-CoA hydrolase